MDDGAASRPDAVVEVGTAGRLYVALYLLLGQPYLIWRTSTVGTTWILLLSMPLLWAEAWSWVQVMGLRQQTIYDRPAGAPGARVQARTANGEQSADAVPVVVLTRHSNASEELERTLVGLAALDYDGPIRVVADTASPDFHATLVQAADHLQLEYVVDPAAALEPLDAVLRHSGGTWAIWLDAGQVPMPGFRAALDPRSIGPRVAVVQTAVGLLNSKSLVHVQRGGDEDALERCLIGPSMSRRGVAPWHGPGSLLRREAFDNDGPSRSVAEWWVELQRRGWRIGYQDQQVIRVPASDAIHSYLAARRRRGIAILEHLGYSFSTPGVPWPTRRAALAAAISVTHGLRQLGLLTILVASLLIGRLPVADEAPSTMAAIAGFAMASAVARSVLSGGIMGFGGWVRHGWRTLGADVAALVPRLSRKFEPLLQRLELGGTLSVGRLQLLVLAFVVFEVAFAARAFNTVHPMLLPTMSRRDSVVILVVSIATTVGMIDVLGGVARQRGRRRVAREPLDTEIVVAGRKGTTLDVTTAGVAALVETAPPSGIPIPVAFTVNRYRGNDHRVTALAEVRSATRHESGAVRLGLEFIDLAYEHRLALTEFCALGTATGQATRPTGTISPDDLDVEWSSSNLALIRLLSTIAVTAAVGALFLGPAAGSVAAEGLAVTPIPERFLLAAPDPTIGADRLEMIVADPDGFGPLPVHPVNDSIEQNANIRLYTDSWSDPLPINPEGGFDRPPDQDSWPGPVFVSITVGDGRHVAPLAADGVVELARIRLAGGLGSVELVGPGGFWRTHTDGDVLVPGRYTLRRPIAPGTDGVSPDVDRIELASGQLLVVGLDGLVVIDGAGAAARADPVPSTSTTSSSTSSSTTSTSTASTAGVRADPQSGTSSVGVDR